MDAIASMLRAHALVSADPDAAEAICRDVALAEPENGFALHLLGVLRLKRGDAREAQELLRRALAAREGHVDSRLALAEAYARDGDDDAASRELRAVLEVSPRNATVLAALSLTRLRQGDAEAATLLARQARAAAPDAAAPLVALGTALAAKRQLPAAREALALAVSRDPDNGQAHLNLGNVLLDLDEEEAAERHVRHATVLMASSPEAWASLGFLLAGTDRLAEAIAACDRAIGLRPDFAQAYWNRSFARLRAGDFAQGWADYEWRRRHPVFGLGAHVLPGEEWDGGDLSGRRLLVNASQGLGDTIQLARYLPLLAARGADVTLRCPAAVMRLLAPMPVRLLPRGEPLPAYGVWIDQMSLPGRFGTTLATIPAAEGYLRAAPRPGSDTGLRVGVVCAGNPGHSNDFRRSMPPHIMAGLRHVPGVTFTSLQLGPAAATLAEAFAVSDRSRDMGDLAETAEIVAGLDLVISVDTAVAHLAGALGRPVWVLVPRAPDWRWPAGLTDSPWYASARVFRQARAGDWTGTIRDVAAALSECRAALLRPTTRVSLTTRASPGRSSAARSRTPRSPNGSAAAGSTVSRRELSRGAAGRSAMADSGSSKSKASTSMGIEVKPGPREARAGRSGGWGRSAQLIVAVVMESGSRTGSPRLILSTFSMPDTTSPHTVYWRSRKPASSKQMKNCELAESGFCARAIEQVPRLWCSALNSCLRFGYFEPPVPVPWGQPVCAMKPSMTRWKTMPS